MLSELSMQYRRFNTLGTQFTVCLNLPTSETTPPHPVSHFLASMNECLITLYKM
jgi:hypothetical protein